MRETAGLQKMSAPVRRMWPNVRMIPCECIKAIRMASMVAATLLTARIPIPVLALMLAAAAVDVQAQQAGTRLDVQQRELQRLRGQIEQAQQTRDKLREEQRALQEELARISRDLVALAAKAQALEQQAAAAEQRIAQLEHQRGAVLARLTANRAATARLLAALQRLRRDPPPPFVSNPDDVLAAVRGALGMSKVLPSMDAQARALRDDLQRLDRLENKLREERAAHAQNLARLRETSGRLQGMLQLKRELLGRTRQRLDDQQRRLARLMKQATTLGDLLQALRHEQERQRKAQEAEKTRRLARREPPSPPLAPALKPWRTKPFAQLKGRLNWPAQGRRLVAFGQKTKLAGTSRGLYLATRAGAVVISPADAKVEMAGPFRSFGNLVILDVGDGYLIVMMGLGELSVRSGEKVRAGEPIGRMGARPAPGTVVDDSIARTQPVLYMELRKGRKPLDPSRWFAGGRRQASRN